MPSHSERRGVRRHEGAVRLELDAAGDYEWVRPERYSIPHTVGTCAMGDDPDNGSVVDSQARVHGINRLAVIDASIIPLPPSGFPHIVTTMLAERLSSELADDKEV